MCLARGKCRNATEQAVDSVNYATSIRQDLLDQLTITHLNGTVELDSNVTATRRMEILTLLQLWKACLSVSYYGG